MFKKLLKREHRQAARDITRTSWIEAGGNVREARKLAKPRVKQYADENCGSILLAITIGALILQLVYYGLKIWKEMNVGSLPPIFPQPWEPFDLTEGDE